MVNFGRKKENEISISEMFDVYTRKIKRVKTHRRLTEDKVKNPRSCKPGISPWKSPRKRDSSGKKAHRKFETTSSTDAAPSHLSKMEAHWPFPIKWKRCKAKVNCGRENRKAKFFCFPCNMAICDGCWWPHHGNMFQIPLSAEEVISKIGSLTEEGKDILRCLQNIPNPEADILEQPPSKERQMETPLKDLPSSQLSGTTTSSSSFSQQSDERLQKMREHMRGVKKNLSTWSDANDETGNKLHNCFMITTFTFT